MPFTGYRWFKALLYFVIGMHLSLLSGCASTHTNRLRAENREMQLKYSQQTEALSRENQVLYEAKIALEKETAILKNKLEDLQSQLASEKANAVSYRESTRLKLQELEGQAKTLEENGSRKIQELGQRNRAAVDSLLSQIDTLSAQLSRGRQSSSAEVQNLKNELAKQKYNYDKERYALERMKEELFAKLQEQERKIQQILMSRPVSTSSSPADTGAGRHP